MSEMISGISNKVFFCSKEEFDKGIKHEQMACIDLDTHVISEPEPEPEHEPWQNSFSAEVVMNKEQRDRLMRLMTRTAFGGNNVGDGRSKTITLSSEGKVKEPDVTGVAVDTKGDVIVAGDWCVEYNKREYRHTNPSRYRIWQRKRKRRHSRRR